MATEGKKKVRIDKWLWATRCFKTRTLATKACDAGHCKVDGRTVKASQKVKVGQRVEVITPGGERVLEIVALAEKRGPASVAVTLYEDHTPPPEPVDPVERLMRQAPVFEREAGAGRPTKRDRRRLRKARRDDWD